MSEELIIIKKIIKKTPELGQNSFLKYYFHVVCLNKSCSAKLDIYQCKSTICIKCESRCKIFAILEPPTLQNLFASERTNPSQRIYSSFVFPWTEHTVRYPYIHLFISIYSFIYIHIFIYLYPYVHIRISMDTIVAVWRLMNA